MKKCITCLKSKDESAFRKWRNSCKTCGSKQAADWSKNNKSRRNETRKKHYELHKTKVRSRQLQSMYGIDLIKYNEMFIIQNGLCAICDKPERSIYKQSGNTKKLAIDHCHTTGKVRGLLCEKCNRGIGYLEDNPTLLKKATRYLS